MLMYMSVVSLLDFWLPNALNRLSSRWRKKCFWRIVQGWLRLPAIATAEISNHCRTIIKFKISHVGFQNSFAYRDLLLWNCTAIGSSRVAKIEWNSSFLRVLLHFRRLTRRSLIGLKSHRLNLCSEIACCTIYTPPQSFRHGLYI